MTLHPPAGGTEVLRRLQEAGYEAYFVGGCVRDSLLGRTPKDWDICTSALPTETKAALAGMKLTETGIAHGTVTAVCRDGIYEVTTYRTETGYADHRHPDRMEFVGKLREDLRRRDFTVNAMAWNDTAGLVDLFGGADDLKCGLIRAVGEPERRFTEDALRILRALRFGARYGYAIEEQTACAMVQGCTSLSLISAERRLAELLGFLEGKTAGRLTESFFPVLAAAVPQLRGQDPGKPGKRIDRCREDPELRLCALLWDTDGAGAARALRCPGALEKKIRTACRYRETPIPQSAPAMRRMVREIGCEAAELQCALWAADKREQAGKASEILHEIRVRGDCTDESALAVTSRALMDAGIPAGPVLGSIRRALLELVMDEKIPNHREDLLAAAAEIYQRTEKK